jgi:hypothetical protein
MSRKIFTFIFLIIGLSIFTIPQAYSEEYCSLSLYNEPKLSGDLSTDPPAQGEPLGAKYAEATGLKFKENAKVKVTAFPRKGYKLDHFDVNGKIYGSIPDFITITMSWPGKRLTAHYKPEKKIELPADFAPTKKIITQPKKTTPVLPPTEKPLPRFPTQ